MLILILVLLLMLALTFASGTGGKPTDSREPYLHDHSGHVWALKVGPVVNPEDYIHDSTPYQNPAITEEGRWFLIIPLQSACRVATLVVRIVQVVPHL